MSKSVPTTPLVISRAEPTTPSTTCSSLSIISSMSTMSSGRSCTEAGDSTSSVGEISVEELRYGEKAGTSKVLRVLEHQEVVQVADQDSTELQNSITCEGIKIFVVFSFQQKISRKIMNFRPNKTQGKQMAGN